jgi:hypothetical protein
VQLHGTRVKVMSLSVNPQQTSLLLSTGNDRLIRLWDIRKLPVCSGSAGKHTDISSSGVYTDDDNSSAHDSNSSSSTSSSTAKSRHFAAAAARAQCLGEVELPRIASNAVFSPHSGTKILATCGDNRLRIWSNFCSTGLTSAAAVEHIHSHDFNRYLAHFRAVFDPKDPCERRLIVGRYISEALYDLPLKPVDVLDAETGALIAELAHPAQKLICPVNAVHPSEDVICSGASTHVISWQWRVTGDRWTNSCKDTIDSSDVADDVSDSEHCTAVAMAGSSGSSSSVQCTSFKAAVKGGVLVRDSSSSSSSSMKKAVSSSSSEGNSKGGTSGSNIAARSTKQQKKAPSTKTATAAAATISTPKCKAARVAVSKHIAKKHSAAGTGSSGSRYSCSDSVSVIDNTVSPYFSRAASNTYSSSDHNAEHHTVVSSSTCSSGGNSSVTTPSRSATAGTSEFQQVAVTSPFFAAVRSPHTAYSSNSTVSGVLVRPALSSGSSATCSSSQSHNTMNSTASSISSGLSALQLRRRSQSSDARSRLAVGCSSVNEHLLHTP